MLHCWRGSLPVGPPQSCEHSPGMGRPGACWGGGGQGHNPGMGAVLGHVGGAGDRSAVQCSRVRSRRTLWFPVGQLKAGSPEAGVSPSRALPQRQCASPHPIW